MKIKRLLKAIGTGLFMGTVVPLVIIRALDERGEPGKLNHGVIVAMFAGLLLLSVFSVFCFLAAIGGELIGIRYYYSVPGLYYLCWICFCIWSEFHSDMGS